MSGINGLSVIFDVKGILVFKEMYMNTYKHSIFEKDNQQTSLEMLRILLVPLWKKKRVWLILWDISFPGVLKPYVDSSRYLTNPLMVCLPQLWIFLGGCLNPLYDFV